MIATQTFCYSIFCRYYLCFVLDLFLLALAGISYSSVAGYLPMAANWHSALDVHEKGTFFSLCTRVGRGQWGGCL